MHVSFSAKPPWLTSLVELKALPADAEVEVSICAVNKRGESRWSKVIVVRSGIADSQSTIAERQTRDRIIETAK